MTLRSCSRTSEAPTYDIRHTIASGDLVLTRAAVRSEGRDHVVFDIFRFDDGGSIAEHWAVAQDRVPSRRPRIPIRASKRWKAATR